MKPLNRIKYRFNNRELLYMLLPVIANDLTSVLVNIVDSIMVSSAGEAAVSGISLAGSLFHIFTIFFNALSLGCTVVVSQYIGSRNLEKARGVGRQSVLIGLSFSLPITIILLISISALLQLIYPNTDPAIMTSAKLYLLIVTLALPSIAIQDMLVGMIRAMGKNRIILILGLVRNALNVIGNAVLIYGYNMGVAGAAIATTASSYICCSLCFIMARNPNLPVNIRGLLKTRFERTEVKRILSVGIGNSLERALLMIGKTLISAMYADLSANAISAYYVSQNISTFCWTFFFSFGTVLTTVVGQCIGADEPEQAKYYTKKFICITVPLCFLFNGILFLLRNDIVHIYALSGDALALAAQYTGVSAILTACCLYPMAILPAYSFRAAGDTLYAALSSTIITFVFQVGLCFLFVKCFHWGIYGVLLSVGADWIARVIVHAIRFHSGKWLTKRIV